MKIKTGDKVKIISGADRGKEGKVTQVFPKMNRVVVEGVRVAKRHLSSKRKGVAGQKIEFSAPIDVSNVRLVCAKDGSAGRVGYKFLKEEGRGKKIRVIRSRGKITDAE